MSSSKGEQAVGQFSKKAKGMFDKIPIIDLDTPDLTEILQACQEFGFFKLINHGIAENELEANALEFFKKPQAEKDQALGYGSRNIGRQGDMGLVEYLLFIPFSIPREATARFHGELENYIQKVNSVSCKVLELITQGLNIEQNVLAELIKDDTSDCVYRINHYPLQPKPSGKNLVGFGEHTDPQIISVLWSNKVDSLEICLKDGNWVSVKADPNALFISVGDCLEVLTNGKFKSVRHRVSASSSDPRLSMIYFAAPRLDEKIAPLPALLEQGERELYEAFTWSEFKQSLGGSRLGDNRLAKYKIQSD